MNTSNRYQVPIFTEFSDYTQKVRKNLFIFSFISIFITFYDIEIKIDGSLIGFQFKNLDTEKLYIGLLVFIIYLLFHFIWLAIEKSEENKIKIFEKHEVIHWSTVTTNNIEILDNTLSVAIKKLEELKTVIPKIDDNTITHSNYMTRIQSSVNSLTSIMQNEEFKTMFNKFDNCYSFYLKSQNLRWTIVELMLPIILGIISIFFLSQSIYKL